MSQQDLFGVGLRTSFYPRLEASLETQLDWFEIISENFMFGAGRPRDVLSYVAQKYPLGFHGVSLNIASHQSLDFAYLKNLRDMAQEFQPLFISDHLCWTGLAQSNLHNLLPIPFNRVLLAYLAERIEQVQDYLERPLVLENLSAYISLGSSEFSEWDFLALLSQRTGCKLLVDLNNIYVNSQNQGFDAQEYLDAIPAEAIAQYHLAGFSQMDGFLFDTHSHPVYPEVWTLYRYVLQQKGIRPTLLEWDDDIPEFERVEAEVLKAKKIWQEVKSQSHTYQTVRAQSGKPTSTLSFDLKDLEDYQNSFVSDIQSGNLQQSSVTQYLHETPALTIEKALRTYRDDYTARLSAALADTYAATEYAVGTEAFKQLSMDFIRFHVSRQPDLGGFGYELPVFVKAHSLSQAYPYLSELCRLERCFRELFLADACGSTDWSLLEEHAQPEQLCFQITSEAFIFVSDYPLFDLWTWNKNPDRQISFESGYSEFLLLFKNHLGVRSRRLNRNQYVLLSALMRKESLGMALERLEDSATEDVAQLFALLRSEDLVVNLIDAYP